MYAHLRIKGDKMWSNGGAGLYERLVWNEERDGDRGKRKERWERWREGNIDR